IENIELSKSESIDSISLYSEPALLPGVMNSREVFSGALNYFDFLGQNVRKFGKKVLTRPSNRNVQTFLDTIRGVVKGHKQVTAGELVRMLNPKIRGWANYHCRAASKATFGCVDHAIFEVLWWWCKRRHPNKHARWVKAKYFTTVGGDNWVFHGTLPKKDGSHTVHLRRAYHTRIRRHVPLHLETNPYDPAWAAYLRRRHRPGGNSTPATGSLGEDVWPNIVTPPPSRRRR
ncbi:MAG: hypothetical protein NTY02_20505, partial [Acidobacteria bacterium]|nr:hypothetical protein [Acidobacteriota bacterium]